MTNADPAPIRVLHVINQLTGGRGHFLAAGAPYWIAHGIQPVILTSGVVIPKLRAFLEGAGIPILQPAEPVTTPDALSRLIGSTLRSTPCDVVHLHDRKSLNLHIRLTRRWHRGPLVATIHGCTLHRTRFLRIASWIAHQWSQKRFGVTFVTVSSDVQENERQNHGLVCPCITNWIQPERFTPPDPALRAQRRREWNIPDGVPVLVTVANCATIKRHQLLLYSLGRLKEKMPDFLFLHAGQEVDDREQRLAKSLGLEDRVRFLGRVADTPGLLQACDLFIMTSRLEGLSMASIEALSAGLPAVLTKSPGLNGLAAFFSGLFYADPTPEALADAIQAAVRSLPAFREQQARINHETACRLFSPDVGAAAYAALYRDLIARSSSRKQERPT